MRGFSPRGSSSRMTWASQPSVATFSGSQVCQMSRARKWERLEFSYPIPCTMATCPSRYSSRRGPAAGWKARVSEMGSTWSWGIPMVGRVS